MNKLQAIRQAVLEMSDYTIESMDHEALATYITTQCVEYARSVAPEAYETKYKLTEMIPTYDIKQRGIGFIYCKRRIEQRIDQDLQSLTETTL